MTELLTDEIDVLTLIEKLATKAVPEGVVHYHLDANLPASFLPNFIKVFRRVRFSAMIIDDNTRFVLAADLCHDQRGDTLIGVWEMQTGKLVKVLRGHNGRVNSVRFNPKGTLIATTSDDCTVKIWQTNNWINTVTVICLLGLLVGSGLWIIN